MFALIALTIALIITALMVFAIRYELKMLNVESQVRYNLDRALLRR